MAINQLILYGTEYIFIIDGVKLTMVHKYYAEKIKYNIHDITPTFRVSNLVKCH